MESTRFIALLTRALAVTYTDTFVPADLFRAFTVRAQHFNLSLHKTFKGHSNPSPPHVLNVARKWINTKARTTPAPCSVSKTQQMEQ
jgi:hypothetical protein